MKTSEILKCVDHTVLGAYCSWKDIDQLCKEAVEYQTASVCIPPSYIARARASHPKLRICTVISFPFGYSTTQAKVAEIEQAIADGADELDVVINLGDVKNGDSDKLFAELTALRAACGDRVLKIIIETCYLTEEEKILLCQLVTKSGADYIKTSTGYGTAGATAEDILLFKKHIGEKVKIKASGGIRKAEDFERYIELGCDRIGSSSAIKVFGNV